MIFERDRSCLFKMSSRKRGREPESELVVDQPKVKRRKKKKTKPWVRRDSYFSNVFKMKNFDYPFTREIPGLRIVTQKPPYDTTVLSESEAKMDGDSFSIVNGFLGKTTHRDIYLFNSGLPNVKCKEVLHYLKNFYSNTVKYPIPTKKQCSVSVPDVGNYRAPQVCSTWFEKPNTIPLDAVILFGSSEPVSDAILKIGTICKSRGNIVILWCPSESSALKSEIWDTTITILP